LGKKSKVRAVLDAHEAYTVIYYGDNDERVGYQCKCGAKDEPDGELFGRSWLVNHQTNEIVKAI
jgi:hypothetical protein